MVTKMGKRIFIIDNRENPDPNPAFSVEEVRKHYAMFYAELNNATTTKTKQGEDTIIRFEKVVGTKGADVTMTLDEAIEILENAIVKGAQVNAARNIVVHCMKTAPMLIVHAGKPGWNEWQVMVRMMSEGIGGGSDSPTGIWWTVRNGLV